MKPTNRRPSNIKQPIKQEPPKRFTSAQKLSNNTIKQTSKPSTYIPKYKKQVDVLSYANNIIQKANSTDINSKMVKDQMADSLQLKQKQHTKNFHYTQQQKQLTKQKKQDSFTKPQEGKYQIPKPQKKANITKKQNEQETVQNSRAQLYQIVSRYQTMQKQLLSKVDALQQQLYQMKQADKKNANIVKQHKNCGKQIKKLTQCIKQHEIQFNRYVCDSNVPYNNKRQVILQSHIQKLKQYNKQLTVRLKAYKGTEIQTKANPAVKVYVLNDYQKDKQIDYSLQKLQFQSLAFKINKQLQSYLSRKIKKNISFTQQQKHITNIINLLNQFGFECLLQGLRVQNEQIDVENFNVNFQERVESQKQYPPINDQYNKIVKHSIFNLSVINQTKQVIQNIKPLLSKLSKPSTTIFDCFRFSKKLPQIQQRIEQTLGTQIRMIKNTNNVLLSVLATTLGRYDIMKNYVDNLIRDVRKKLKEISVPLDDLNNLYEYKDKRQDVFKEKLSVFVSSNIQKMCLKIPQLQKQMQQIPIRFSKLINFI